MKRPTYQAARLARILLQVPLFYKVVVANVVFVIMAAILSAALTAAFLRPDGDPPGPATWVVAGVALLFVVVTGNALLVRLALHPLQGLESTARKVEEGHGMEEGQGMEEARAPVSPLADRDLQRTIHSFNGMLDELVRYRRRLQRLAARGRNAQEEERLRIARELHDDTAQRLAALLLQLRGVEKEVGEGPLSEQIDAIRSELVETLEDLRRIARGLRPPALGELGLSAAVRAHARELEERFSGSIHVQVEGELPELGSDSELAAYRIIQEALTNVVRHSGASWVEVRMKGEADALRIVVEDDGSGFDPSDVLDRREDSVGLIGMHERAAYVGGRVDVNGRPGRGTRVTVKLPPDPLPGEPQEPPRA